MRHREWRGASGPNSTRHRRGRPGWLAGSERDGDPGDLAALWDASGLDERVVLTYGLDPVREIRHRFRWVGLRRLLAGSIHAVRLYLTEPSARPVLDTMLVSLRAGPEDEPGAPPPWASFGYGRFVGRKRADVDRIRRCAAESPLPG